MKDWEKTLVGLSTSILQALKIIDSEALQIALVVDEYNTLLGTVTDGDVRRGLLNGRTLEDTVAKIMYSQPSFIREGESSDRALSMMKQKHLSQLPVVDENMKVVGLKVLGELLQPIRRNNLVVLMAGGEGARLRPLTDKCPKPLLKIGNKPILETIINNFVEHGFYRFYVSVNYKADMIEDYFGNGTAFGVEIEYLREKDKLGTAGALSLLPERPSQPILIMNGDLLTKVNFKHLLNFHNKHKAQATMCVREYNFQVPYGVVQLDKHRLTGIVEKPIQQFFVSAGVYVLSPEVINLIPQGTFFDMPNLFDKLIADNYETAVFPVREYWLDIGRMSDYEKANGEFSEVFT